MLSVGPKILQHCSNQHCPNQHYWYFQPKTAHFQGSSLFSLSNAGFRCFKSELFKEKSALLKKIFNVDENLNNADFSLSNAQGPQNGFYLGEARKFFIQYQNFTLQKCPLRLAKFRLSTCLGASTVPRCLAMLILRTKNQRCLRKILKKQRGSNIFETRLNQHKFKDSIAQGSVAQRVTVYYAYQSGKGVFCWLVIT